LLEFEHETATRFFGNEGPSQRSTPAPTTPPIRAARKRLRSTWRLPF
jgi:hypothetical protein